MKRFLLVATIAAGCSSPEPMRSPADVPGADAGRDVSVPPADFAHPVVSAVHVTPVALVLERGRTAPLSAEVLDQAGEVIGVPVTWSSSDVAVAEVTASGVVIGHAFGDATISATADGVTGHGTVRVQGAPVSRITVSPLSRDLRPGDAITLDVAMYDAQNAPIEDARQVGFESSDSNVVTVSPDGLVTAVSAGSAWVTTAVEAITARSDFRVVEGAPVDRVEVSPVAVELIRGQSVTLNATAFSGGAAVDNVAFSWVSADPQVATVDETGEVVAVGVGTTTIEVSADGASSIAAVGVTFPFSTLVASHDSVCGLVAGVAHCWGRNDAGQLGRADTSVAPGAVETGARFAELAAGAQHFCGISTGGETFCWGAGAATPSMVPGGHAFVRLRAGFATTCGVDGPGALWCWSIGESPSMVGAYDDATIGGGHRCVVAGTTGYCWGENTHGELGINSPTPSVPTPTAVTGGFALDRVFAGADHTCATTTSGVPLCWGRNDAGQVGDGTTTPRLTPILVGGMASVSRLAVGPLHACGLRNDGAPYCWGRNDGDRLGTGGPGDVLTPTAVATTVRFVGLTAGDGFTCGVSLVGDPYCWGVSDHGQLGAGGASHQPIRVTGL